MEQSGLQVGTTIDTFRLEERLHQGSMAALWRVLPADGGQPLVMKVPSLQQEDDPTAIVGFEVEQMILPTLAGIHVPRLVASGDFSRQPYLVMELIPGQSLRPRLEQAPLPAEEVASIGARVAAALHDLHGQHVIHLDVKPSNIMFRETGEVVLIDYGLARHDHLPDLLAEQFRVPMGTAPYMSPEQIRRNRSDPRSDLFAIGVMLYHLVTGARPFGNPMSIRGLRRRLYRDPVPPRARNPACPPRLQEVILRCLEVDPAQRYQTAAQLAFDLQHSEQVTLSGRSRRLVRDGAVTVARRWMRTLATEGEPGNSVVGRLAKAPIVLVAIDVGQTSPGLDRALRVAARRVFESEPGARLACVTVLRTSRLPVTAPATVDAEGRNLRVTRLVELKHWARPLEIVPGRVTYHVLESPDAAGAIIEFAATNKVDQIVIGARGSSALRRYLGSVSSQVVAEADCTVTVVKAADSDARG
ncbi:MAG: protein kinase domain-containing protein [Myxococcaceae bacterium]